MWQLLYLYVLPFAGALFAIAYELARHLAGLLVFREFHAVKMLQHKYPCPVTPDLNLRWYHRTGIGLSVLTTLSALVVCHHLSAWCGYPLESAVAQLVHLGPAAQSAVHAGAVGWFATAVSVPVWGTFLEDTVYYNDVDRRKSIVERLGFAAEVAATPGFERHPS